MKRALPIMLIALGLSSCLKNEDSNSDSKDDGVEETTSTSRKSEYKRIRDEIAGLKKVKRELEEKIDDFEDAQKDQSGLLKQEVEVAGKLEEVMNYESALNAYEQELDQALSQWRVATRASFKGVQIPEIKTVKGETYSAVSITDIGDDSITISHSGGTATIPALDLPLSLRKNVLHEPTVLAQRPGN